MIGPREVNHAKDILHSWNGLSRKKSILLHQMVNICEEMTNSFQHRGWTAEVF